MAPDDEGRSGDDSGSNDESGDEDKINGPLTPGDEAEDAPRTPWGEQEPE